MWQRVTTTSFCCSDSDDKISQKQNSGQVHTKSTGHGSLNDINKNIQRQEEKKKREALDHNIRQ